MSSLAPSSQPAPTKPSLPIDLLPTNLARLVSQAHPALLLAAYYIRFPALVADPVSTLLQSLLPVAVIQIAYAVTCLPAVGAGAKPVAKKVKLNAPKKGGESQVGRKAFTAILSLLLTLFTTLPLFTLQILFGAPLTTHLPHTLLSSAHLALLSLFPLFYVHGTSASKWREIISIYSPIDEVFGGSVGAFIGAWLGAVPIPLDWDREWQAWPITVVTGAYLGYGVGKVVGGWVLKGKRVEFD
ncbi:related to GPI-anchor biosynthesis protein PIG-F [Phialocephala subalpina]|uniref:Related to GPI-anchor biosynthesis protein PIG-F n=1 Tax=Phialocephala subalpina TaxID=576137 RepID=A0A1L7WK13_9HELO|nr:related to GPI-anchor biosynthesis protein PIG-F [Phialocephala subalpina]